MLPGSSYMLSALLLVVQEYENDWPSYRSVKGRAMLDESVVGRLAVSMVYTRKRHKTATGSIRRIVPIQLN
jgi:hypothetical protein